MLWLVYDLLDTVKLELTEPRKYGVSILSVKPKTNREPRQVRRGSRQLSRLCCSHRFRLRERSNVWRPHLFSSPNLIAATEIGGGINSDELEPLPPASPLGDASTGARPIPQIHYCLGPWAFNPRPWRSDDWKLGIHLDGYGVYQSGPDCQIISCGRGNARFKPKVSRYNCWIIALGSIQDGAMRSDRPIAPRERKCHTCAKGIAMTDEQMKALEAVRAAFVAAEATGLTEAEIWHAVATGLVQPEVKGGRPPGNYNPIADGLDESKK